MAIHFVMQRKETKGQEGRYDVAQCKGEVHNFPITVIPIVFCSLQNMLYNHRHLISLTRAID